MYFNPEVYDSTVKRVNTEPLYLRCHTTSFLMDLLGACERCLLLVKRRRETNKQHLDYLGSSILKLTKTAKRC